MTGLYFYTDSFINTTDRFNIYSRGNVDTSD